MQNWQRARSTRNREHPGQASASWRKATLGTWACGTRTRAPGVGECKGHKALNPIPASFRPLLVQGLLFKISESKDKRQRQPGVSTAGSGPALTTGSPGAPCIVVVLSLSLRGPRRKRRPPTASPSARGRRWPRHRRGLWFCSSFRRPRSAPARRECLPGHRGQGEGSPVSRCRLNNERRLFRWHR